MYIMSLLCTALLSFLLVWSYRHIRGKTSGTHLFYRSFQKTNGPVEPPPCGALGEPWRLDSIEDVSTAGIAWSVYHWSRRI